MAVVTAQEPYILEEKILKAIFKREDAILDTDGLLKEEMFTIKDYGYIYRAMFTMYQDNIPINNETVKMWLDDNGICITNTDIIDKLYSEAYTSINIKTTCSIVRELYIRRYILTEMAKFVENCQEKPLSSTEILSKVNDIAMSANDKFSPSGNTDTKVDGLTYLSNVNQLLKHPEEDTKIKTGWSFIDDTFGGFKRGWLVNFTGDSGAGKSYWSNQTALKIASLQPELYIDIFSLEMDKTENTGRLVSIESGLTSNQLENPRKYFDRFDETTGEFYNLYERDPNCEEVKDYLSRIKTATDFIDNTNIYIDDTPDLRIDDLEARVKRNHLKRGRTDVIIIDHTDLLHDGDPQSAVGEITKIYTRLKKLAKKLNCVIITLHQFNNDVKEGDRRPSVFALRGAGTIRHNCDAIMLLYRPAIYPDLINRLPELKNVCDISFAKVRNFKAPEPQNMVFFKNTCGFSEATEEVGVSNEDLLLEDEAIDDINQQL